MLQYIYILLVERVISGVRKLSNQDQAMCNTIDEVYADQIFI